MKGATWQKEYCERSSNVKGVVARKEQHKKNNVKSENMKSSNVLGVATQAKRQCEKNNRRSNARRVMREEQHEKQCKRSSVRGAM